MARNSDVTGFAIDIGGGGGGAGASLIPWTVVPLDTSGFVVHGLGSDWTITNPDATTLRATATHTAPLVWDNTGGQTGLVLIWPTPLNPFPIETPAGYPANQWRSQYAMAKFMLNLTFGTSHASGFALRVHGGPGFVSYTNDQGVTPAAPPFSDIVAQPSWYMYQQTAKRQYGNDQWNAAWSGNGVGFWKDPGGGQVSPGFGTPTQVNRMEMALDYTFPHSQSPIITMCWLDDRATPIQTNWSQSFAPNNSVAADLKTYGKYIYPALFFGNWNTCQNGDYIEITNFKYLVQQMVQVGAE